ncbi:MAG: SH3 domain-containing protein [Phycisphaerae bacterium]|nr:SH3 domain-containing protein [Phycisphaerae bacterium]
MIPVRLVPASSLVRGAALALPLIGGLIGSGVVHTSTVQAQELRETEPYMAVVVRDDTPLRAGNSTIYYAVATLKAGTVVRVDAEGAGWMRVEYPKGINALVKAEDTTGDPAKGLKLLRDSKLRALHLKEGDRASWCPLLEKPLAAGTELSVVQIIKPDAAPTAYVVKAPTGARGFINKDALRKATETEASSSVKAADAPVAPAAAGPTAAESSASPAPERATTPVVITTPLPTAVPAQPGSPEPSAPPPAAPGEPESTNARPAATALPAGPVVRSQKQLIDLFYAVRNEPSDAPRISAAITEFDRAIAALGPSASDRRYAASLQKYRDVLALKIERNNLQRRLDTNRNEAQANIRRTEAVVSEWERNPVYTVVGILLPSNVYNREGGMPLMYRIQSSDRTFPRTLGYVAPTEGLDLQSKVGQLVGVVSHASRYDEALRVTIMAPDRVDLLGADGSAAKITPVPPQPATTPPTTKPAVPEK